MKYLCLISIGHIEAENFDVAKKLASERLLDMAQSNSGSEKIASARPIFIPIKVIYFRPVIISAVFHLLILRLLEEAK